MEATYFKIEENNIDTLIFDVTYNIGGNVEYAKYLMSYITDQPFRLYGSIEAKISDPVIAQDSYMRDNYSEQIGSIVSAEFNDEARPYEDVVPFDGDVYIMISNQTFNAASEFAALIKDYDAATLVGSQTATNPSSYKSIHLVTSHYLNTSLAIPYQYFTRPNGEDTQTGVTPDIEVEKNVLDHILTLLN